MVFQNPMTSLNPVWPIGNQIAESAMLHRVSAGARRDGARSRCCKRVGIPSAEARVDDYPHQWSGGMMQRAVIAMAMAGDAEAAAGRRADHGTRRHHPGPDPVAADGAPARDRHGPGARLPRHGGHRRDLRPRRRHVCGPHRRARADRVQLFEAPRHPYTHGPVALDPAAEKKSGRLPSISGQPPDLARLGRLPVRRALRRRQRGMPYASDRAQRVGEGHATACLFPERMAELDRKAAS